MYDVIIIGKGPAGISASLYTSRANLNTLIFGRTSELNKSHRIENYYGFVNGIAGDELLSQGEKQSKLLGTQIIEDEVIALDYDFEGTFTVQTKEKLFYTRSVLLATGSKIFKVPIKNIQKFEGKGVHYCTTCDGNFYRGKRVGLLGFSEYALHELKELKHFTNNIVLLTNGYKEMADFEGIEVNTKKIISLEGEQYLEKAIYEDGSFETLDGIFSAYGTASSTDFARKLGILIKNDIIQVDENQKTNLDGLYAAGDCSSTIKQIAVSVGQGAIAGINIAQYIRKLGR